MGLVCSCWPCGYGWCIVNLWIVDTIVTPSGSETWRHMVEDDVYQVLREVPVADEVDAVARLKANFYAFDPYILRMWDRIVLCYWESDSAEGFRAARGRGVAAGG